MTPVETPGNQPQTEVVIDFEIFGRRFMALNGGPDAAGRARATQAMLQMQKLDLDALRAAYLGDAI